MLTFAAKFVAAWSLAGSFPSGLDRLRQQLKSDVAQMSKILYSFENWSCEDCWKQQSSALPFSPASCCSKRSYSWLVFLLLILSLLPL